MKKVFFFCIILLNTCIMANAQTSTISGTVSEKGTFTTLTGVRLQLIDQTDSTKILGTWTDNKGEFTVKNIPPGDYQLKFSMLGYKKLDYGILRVMESDNKVINIEMEDDAVKMGAVIVTASRKSEKALDAPASISIVDSKEISQNNSLTPIDNIRTVQGVDMVQKGLMQKDYSIRGLNNVFSGATLTFTDGRLANLSALKANVSYLFPIIEDDIDRIEVVLGPGSALWGPNASNGIVNIITKSPFASKGTTISLSGGEMSFMQGAIRNAGTFGDNFGYKITAQYTSAQDWNYIDSNEKRGGITYVPRDNKISNYNVNARLDYLFSDNMNAFVSFGYSNAVKNIDITDQGAAMANNFSNMYIQARYNWGDFMANVYLNQNDAGNTYLLNTGDTIKDNSQKFVVQLQHGFSFSDWEKLTYGADMFLTRPKTFGTINGLNENKDDINEFGGYIQSETQIIPDKLDLVLAGRIDKHNSLNDIVFSPRAALVFKPIENQNFRLTYNTAYASPASSDLYLDMVAYGNVFDFPLDLKDFWFDLRGSGVPLTGYHFDRKNGLQFHTTYTGDTSSIPVASASTLWKEGLTLLSNSVDDPPTKQLLEALINNVPIPDAQQVSSLLRLLNMGKVYQGDPFPFNDINDSAVTDISALRPTVTQTIELGYKGVFDEKLQFSLDFYYNKIKDFITLQNVFTPNVFLNGTDSKNYLKPFIKQIFIDQGMPEPEAEVRSEEAATQIGYGLTQIPLGTVTPMESKYPKDIMLAPVNFGNIEYWGIDLAIDYAISNRMTIKGTYSFMNKNYFMALEGLSDLSLNAPKHKASFALEYKFPNIGLGIEARYRFNDGFRVKSAVYEGIVNPYGLIDMSISYNLPFVPNMILNVAGTNLLDFKHNEFIGTPEIGRFVSGKLTYNF
ncbi:MAG: TonB-dependent receptor [Bacteroidetes bacterium]|nr:MAG: TonB-dependent receptor [Bacteroidota bacterium]